MEEENNEEFMKKVFDDLRHDYKEAKDAKTTIDDLIQQWNDLYYGNKRDKHGEVIKNKPNKSSIVMREVAKQIEWQKPNITEPFVSTTQPINLIDIKDAMRAQKVEKWANQEFTQEFDREEFIEQVADVVLREGTAWIQTSWETKSEVEVTKIPIISIEKIIELGLEPTEISENNDGTYSIEYSEERLVLNNPYSTVMRNEHVYPDPGARTEKEMRFLAVEKQFSISDLKSIDWIDQEKVDQLADRVTSEEKEDTSLGMARNANGREYGQDDNYEPNDSTRKHIKIIEYWGYYDLNEDGVAEPIVAMWAEKYNIFLSIEENPFPYKGIPFDRVVYSSRPFSLWGNALAFFLGENQHAKTGIVRGIMDNMAIANNGQKFIAKGAIDYVNFKRLNNGERYIMVNKPDLIKDGSFNQLPSSVFNTLELITKESQELSGVSSGGPALTNDHISKDGQQAQLTMSQQRMAALVRNISNLMRKIIGKWIVMAEVFLTDEQIQLMFTEEEMVDMNVFSNSRKVKIQVNVGTEVNRNMKLQQFNMLMQQANALEGELPPGTMKEMVAEMLELFDMHEKATQLRMYKKQPSPEEIQAQQLQLQNAMLENQKIQMQIAVMEKDVEARYMNAQARMMEANANYGYKQAQSAEKMAKTQAHQVDSAMKPVQVENEIMKAQNGSQKMKENNE